MRTPRHKGPCRGSKKRGIIVFDVIMRLAVEIGNYSVVSI